MDPLQALAARLVGTWRSVLVSDKEQSACVRFMDDLRYVGIQHFTPPIHRQHFVEWRMWCELESESVLRMTYYKNKPGSLRTLHFEGEILVLQYTFPLKEGETEPQKPVWHCHRLTDEEIPEWFEEEYRKAMARPWL